MLKIGKLQIGWSQSVISPNLIFEIYYLFFYNFLKKIAKMYFEALQLYYIYLVLNIVSYNIWHISVQLFFSILFLKRYYSSFLTTLKSSWNMLISILCFLQILFKKSYIDVINWNAKYQLNIQGNNEESFMLIMNV